MMTQHIKNDDCTPRLRFPEFVNYNIWEKTIISDILNLNYGKSQSSHSLENGNIPIIGSSGIMGYTNQFISKGPSLIIGRKGTVGSIIYFDGPSYPIDTTYYISFKKNNISTKFIFYILHCININSCRNESAVPGLSKENLYLMSICLPSKQEQQKIADCLTSLDDLITAHEQKAEALRQHKKGLMQRLLPAEGETTPRWRFPEFREAEEWEPKVISDVCSVSTGKSNTQDKIVTGEYPFYVRSSIIEKSKKYLYDEEAVLTVGDGVGTGKVYHYVNGKYDLHQRCYRLYNFKSILGKFVFYFFSTHFYNRVSRMTAKNSVDSVRMSMITEMPLFLPPLPEQQKIADCLSSLDERITAQEAKVAALREHKKGLMQRLFPQAM